MNTAIFSEPDVTFIVPVNPEVFVNVLAAGYLSIIAPEPPAPPDTVEVVYPTKAGPPPPPPVFTAPACPAAGLDAAVSPPPPSPPVPAA